MLQAKRAARRIVISVVAFPVFLFLFFACGTTGEVDRAAGLISRQRVRSAIRYLASDALQGRVTPGAGLDSAAEYIARSFAVAGLQPVHGSFLQPFALNIVSLGDTNALLLETPAGRDSMKLKDDFVPFENTAHREVEAGVVFAGYGISAPEYGYDDYAGIDVRGKIVFVLRHEPGEEDSASVFAGRKETAHSSVASKVRQARERGAVGVLVATDPLNHQLLTPRGFPWPSLSKIIPRDALPLALAVEESEKLPVVHVGERIINGLLGSVDSLRALQRAIDGSCSPRSFSLGSVRVRLKTSTAIKRMPTQNVVGIIQGADPALRNEVVVIGAHYDHIGIKRNAGAGMDSIFNGADDNASGTVALMEVGAALGAMREKPARTLLLIAFAGEEKGLLGSAYYVRNPLFPLEKTVAMLNMDMVGRNAPDSLQIIGSPEGSFLVQDARRANAAVGFLLANTVLRGGGATTILSRNVVCRRCSSIPMCTRTTIVSLMRRNSLTMTRLRASPTWYSERPGLSPRRPSLSFIHHSEENNEASDHAAVNCRGAARVMCVREHGPGILYADLPPSAGNCISLC